MSKVLVVLICCLLAFNFTTKAGDVSQNEENQDEEDYNVERNRLLQPLVLIVENANFDDVFNAAPQAARGVPLSKTKIQDTDVHANTLPLNQHIFYLCPQPTLENALQQPHEYPPSVQSCLFVTKFGPNEPNRCVQQPQGVAILNPKNQNSGERTQSMQEGKFAVMLCYPVVQKDGTTECYRGGIRDFFADQSPTSKIVIKDNYLDLYHFGFNEEEERTEWTLQTVTPMATHWSFTQPPSDSFYRNSLPMFKNIFDSLKSAYDAQDKTKPYWYYWLAHRLAQSTQYPFNIMAGVTSEMINTAPLRNKLQPLIYLVEERIQKLSDHISRPLEVLTRPFYHQIDEHTEKLYLDDNQKFLVPNVWSKLIYDRATSSGIVIVVHNYPEYVPPEGLLCEENAFCEFKRWMRESSQFADAFDDTLIDFAYCCKEAKFPIFKDLKIEGVIDINLNL